MAQIDIAINLNRLDAKLLAAGKRAPVGIARALNRTGVPTSGEYIREARRALGLKNIVSRKGGVRSVDNYVKRAVSHRRANAGRLTYSVAGFGGPIPLKYFGARETRRGVSAAPLNRRQVFAGSFQKGGLFPNRINRKFNPGLNVFIRTGKGKFPIRRLFGPSFPQGMLEPKPVSTFESGAQRRLDKHLLHELDVIILGIA